MRFPRRSDSIERQTRRALRRVVLWKTIGNLLMWPERLFSGLATILKDVGRIFDDLSAAVFNLEQDAARRYFALTQLDLARAIGDDDRYREIRVAAGAEEPEEYPDPDDD